MASPDPTTVGFPAKIPAIPACSGIASSALTLSVAKRRAASRGLADTSGAFTPNRRVKTAGVSMSIVPRESLDCEAAIARNRRPAGEGFEKMRVMLWPFRHGNNADDAGCAIGVTLKGRVPEILRVMLLARYKTNIG